MAALLIARTRYSSLLPIFSPVLHISYHSPSNFIVPKFLISVTGVFRLLGSKTFVMPPKKSEQNGHKIHSRDVNTDNGHQFQAGSSDQDEWKHKEPYKIHGQDNDDFEPKWTGGCHCGRVKYQLSREVPLDAKYCHCTTCQKLHGVCPVSTLAPSCIPLTDPLTDC